MRKFKVGDRIEILEPEAMGVDGLLKPGDIVTIQKVTEKGSGRSGMFLYTPGWIDDGFIRFVDTGETQ